MTWVIKGLFESKAIVFATFLFTIHGIKLKLVTVINSSSAVTDAETIGPSP